MRVQTKILCTILEFDNYPKNKISEKSLISCNAPRSKPV